MTRNAELSPEAADLLRKARKKHQQCQAQPQRAAERRELFLKLRDQGVTVAKIAKDTGASEALVKLEVGRARGAPWALKAAGDVP